MKLGLDHHSVHPSTEENKSTSLHLHLPLQTALDNIHLVSRDISPAIGTERHCTLSTTKKSNE